MEVVMIVVVAAVLMLGIEWAYPAIVQPQVRGWVLRLVCINAVQIAVVVLASVSFERYLPTWHLLDARPLGVLMGSVIGYVAITFVFYWWHRARHEIAWLWRWHQLHHSPVRIEVVTSFYKHPLEILANSILISGVLHVGLGLDAKTAAIVTAIAGVAELVYHWNIATPRWLGFIFQRPESHRRHHERDHHRDNYSDLPLWDMLFGTFDNPHTRPRDCGFADNAEARLGRFLLGRGPQ